jgi:hypothetical protein
MFFGYTFLTLVFFFIIGPIAVRRLQKKAGTKKVKTAKPLLISLAVSCVLSLVAIQAFTSGGSARWKASVTAFTVLPNNYVRVWVSVTNVGNAAGAPSCMVSIQPTNAYGDDIGNGGFDAMDGSHTVNVGATYSGYMDIVVSGNDASYVTSKSMISVSNC